MNRELLNEFVEIAGKENVRTDPGALEGYFKEKPTDIRLVLVTPEDQEMLSEVAALAYEKDIPMYTHRRGYLDKELAKVEGLLIDLKKIDKIIRVDQSNLLAFVQYGVTFERLKEELDRVNMRMLMPAAATSPSIVRSYLDRDIIIANGATRPYQISTFHAILPDGRIWMSGTDAYTEDGMIEFREDIGPMYSYFFHASEDIYGMPYAAKVFIYKRWEDRKVTSYGFDSAEKAMRTAYLASRHDQVFECVVANSVYLAVLLSDSPGDAEKLASELSPWNVVFGFDMHPDLVRIWDKQTGEMAAENGGKPASEELSKRMEEKFEWPWYISDRDYYRGGTKIIDYYTFANKAPTLFAETTSKASAYEIGQLAIPVYYGGAFYCESDIYCGKDDQEAENLRVEIFRELLDKGVHVNRPTGDIAKIVYERLDPENIRMIKNLKKVIDPKGLLNRDQLVEGV